MKVLLALSLLLPMIGAGAADDFAKANEAYAAGKYADARRGYEVALAHGSHANIWFNQGNASFRLNEPGRAALAYERALLAQPTHPEAAANLKFVRNKTGSRVPEPSWKEKAWRYAAQPTASWIAIGVAWLGFLIVGVSLLRRRTRLTLATGILFILLGATGIVLLQMSRAEFAKWAIVVADRADARTEPADRSALAESLPAGSRVQVLSEQGNWTYCVLPGGGRGWVPARHVEKIIPHS